MVAAWALPIELKPCQKHTQARKFRYMSETHKFETELETKLDTKQHTQPHV
jgi:hypothetical protein